MPRVAFPHSGQHTNVGEFSLTGEHAAQVVNLLLDEQKAYSTRPGLLYWVNPEDAGAGLAGTTDQKIIGLAEFQDRVIAVRGNRRIFAIDSAGARLDLDTYLTGWDDPTFLEDDNGRLLIFGGGAPVEITPGIVAGPAASGWSPSATHGAIVDRTLILNDKGSDRIYTSAVDDHRHFMNTDTFDQSGAGFFTAGTRSDEVTAMVGVRNTLLVFGPSSVELWYGTGDSNFPFRLDANPIPSDLLAPRSVVSTGSGVYWLDSARSIVRLQGRETQEVSLAVAAQLEGLSAVEDCIGHEVNLPGHHLVTFTFPAAGLTLCYAPRLDAWTEWRRWDVTTGTWAAMPMRAYVHQTEWNRHFCSGRSNGTVYELSATTYQDHNAPLVRLWRGPFLEHGSVAVKGSSRLQWVVDGGVAQSYTTTSEGYDPVIEVRWQDESRRWTEFRRVRLGLIGERGTVRGINRLGDYRRRQYEWRCSAPVPLRVARVEEDVEQRER